MRVPPDRVEDLAHDVFLALIQALDGGTVVDDPEAYLYTMTLHAGFTPNGRRLRVPEASDNTGLAEAPDAADQFAGLVRYLDLWQILERLPTAQRKAIELRYFQDLSAEEAARRLKVVPATVESNRRDGLRAMRRVMDDQNFWREDI